MPSKRSDVITISANCCWLISTISVIPINHVKIINVVCLNTWTRNFVCMVGYWSATRDGLDLLHLIQILDVFTSLFSFLVETSLLLVNSEALSHLSETSSAPGAFSDVLENMSEMLKEQLTNPSWLASDGMIDPTSEVSKSPREGSESKQRALLLDSDWTDLLSDIMHKYGIDPSVWGVNVLVRKSDESVVWKI